MCGIFLYKSDKIDNSKILNSFKSFSYRGPDQIKNYIKHNIFFGFHRLSIIDENIRSMHPFETDTNIMLFNGEIYNYKEIKNELISKNYKFKTESDTEVLIKAFEEYDTEVTEKIKGMYACAIFNKENNKIFLEIN